MSGITLAQAQAALVYWLDADAKLAAGQSYSIAGRALTRSETLEKIQYWDSKINDLARSSRGGITVRFGTPVTG